MQFFGHQRGEFLLKARQNGIRALQNGQLGAEFGEGLPQLDADIPASDDDQAFGNMIQAQSSRRIENSAAEGEGLQLDGP
ncbi:hypothetical protein D3C87_1726640 [compost metagenome]